MKVRIIKGPHLLFSGLNGSKTYGITVRCDGPTSDVEARGYKREWDINDNTILNGNVRALLDLTDEEHDTLVREIRDLLSGGVTS